MASNVSFRIHQVKCIDETGGWLAEKAGNDEIWLSGFGISPSGETRKVEPFEVYANFDDNDVKKYNPPRNFISLPLLDSGVWPKSIGIGLLLAEKDWGDFGGKVDVILEKVKGAVGSVPAGGGWQAALVMVAPFVLNQVIGVARDDIFPLQSVTLDVPNPQFLWGGQPTSPRATVDFRGHDGIYRLEYDWSLS